MSRLRAWLKQLPIQDPVDRQMAVLLQVILLGLMTIFLAAGLFNVLVLTTTVPVAVLVLRITISLLIVGMPLVLLRRGYFQAAVFIIITLLLFLETFAVLSTNLRAIAETLTFFTFAILLAGLLVGRKALYLTLALSIGALLLNIQRETDPALKEESLVVAGNFILLNGLMSIFLDQFGITLRRALKAAHERELELTNEIGVRKQTEARLQQTTDRLASLHEIDRSLLLAHSMEAIAAGALSQVRKLIPCPRASITLFDLDKKEARFLAADFENMESIPNTPMPLELYGLNVVEVLLQNKPWLTASVLDEPLHTDLDRKLANERGIHAWLSLPLISQGRLIGALNLGRGSGERFTMADAEIAHDIANQLAIAIQQNQLYDSLQEQLAQGDSLIKKLEANNAELERFTYTVSHDLRNPLVTIKGFLGMLARDIKEQRQDKVDDDFKRIAGAADKMDALLSELLELSRIGRIVNPPEAVDFTELANEAIEMLDARLRAANVTVTVLPDLPGMYGDRLRLREVLENLIDNAAKYMGDQPHPQIEIGARTVGEAPIFYVKDNGIGVETTYHTKIFGLFEKLDPSIEGTGIGLALVKRIIETHGGRIWVESEGLGKGSTFCFTLPENKNINK